MSEKRSIYNELKGEITGSQLRAARGLLKWSADDLANVSNVGVATIRRYESNNSVISGNINTVRALQSSLMAAGIIFIGPENGEIGVKLVMGDDKS